MECTYQIGLNLYEGRAPLFRLGIERTQRERFKVINTDHITGFFEESRGSFRLELGIEAADIASLVAAYATTEVVGLGQ